MKGLPLHSRKRLHITTTDLIPNPHFFFELFFVELEDRVAALVPEHRTNQNSVDYNLISSLSHQSIHAQTAITDIASFQDITNLLVIGIL
jgi:hypothetical protein